MCHPLVCVACICIYRDKPLRLSVEGPTQDSVNSEYLPSVGTFWSGKFLHVVAMFCSGSAPQSRQIKLSIGWLCRLRSIAVSVSTCSALLFRGPPMTLGHRFLCQLWIHCWPCDGLKLQNIQKILCFWERTWKRFVDLAKLKTLRFLWACGQDLIFLARLRRL